MGFELAERVVEVPLLRHKYCAHGSRCRRMRRKKWLAISSTQKGIKTTHFTLLELYISGTVDSFQPGEMFTGLRALTIESLLMSRYGSPD